MEAGQVVLSGPRWQQAVHVPMQVVVNHQTVGGCCKCMAFVIRYKVRYNTIKGEKLQTQSGRLHRMLRPVVEVSQVRMVVVADSVLVASHSDSSWLAG
jgi:hypothetical protein